MLVSIIVITYNSSKYVLEALESCHRQIKEERCNFATSHKCNIPSIELVVSDDCSTDDTFEICKQWMQSHGDLFERAICTRTTHNGGICWNYNHALKFAKGMWIKYIAGDDLLRDNCIKSYLSKVDATSKLYFSDMEIINQIGEHKIFAHNPIPSGNAVQQFRHALWRDVCFSGSTIFAKKKQLLQIGGFDMLFPMSEDYPIAMKHLSNGLSIGNISKPLVCWRQHKESVSQRYDNYYTTSTKDSIWYYTHRYCLCKGLLLTWYNIWLQRWIMNHKGYGGFHKVIGYFLRCFDLVHLKRKLIGRPKILEYYQ